MFAIRNANVPSCRTGNRCTDVPNTPKIGYLTCDRLLFYFDSILPRGYKPVYPSPLVFIIRLLEIILYIIALSFGGGFSGCLDDSCRMNSTIASWDTRQSLSTRLAHRYHQATSNYGNFVRCRAQTYKPPFITSAVLERRAFRSIDGALGIAGSPGNAHMFWDRCAHRYIRKNST